MLSCHLGIQVIRSKVASLVATTQKHLTPYGRENCQHLLWGLGRSGYLHDTVSVRTCGNQLPVLGPESFHVLIIKCPVVSRVPA
jgi:hypothetical protein